MFWFQVLLLLLLFAFLGHDDPVLLELSFSHYFVTDQLSRYWTEEKMGRLVGIILSRNEMVQYIRAPAVAKINTTFMMKYPAGLLLPECVRLIPWAVRRERAANWRPARWQQAAKKQTEEKNGCSGSGMAARRR